METTTASRVPLWGRQLLQRRVSHVAVGLRRPLYASVGRLDAAGLRTMEYQIDAELHPRTHDDRVVATPPAASQASRTTIPALRTHIVPGR